MTFIDAIIALLIMGAFLIGFSQAFMPVYSAWNKATAEYNTAKTINFVAESFRNECSKKDMAIENWKKTVASAKELESYGITELRLEDEPFALKLMCVISGERLEIIGKLGSWAK